MRVLVTGGAGYLGSVLVPKLLARGHQVRVADAGRYGLGHLNGMSRGIDLHRTDLRDILERSATGFELLDGCDAVIHLAATTNDADAESDLDTTHTINVVVTTRLAELARQAGVRFFFASTSAVYGDTEREADEFAEVAPLSAVARTKAAAERALDAMSDSSWAATILRAGTLFGVSPCMRFDMVVNLFGLHSARRNQIAVLNDGIDWRPLLHVADCARAFVHFLESPHLQHDVYNVAHENLRVLDLVNVFETLNPHLNVVYVPALDSRRRSCRVSTERMLRSGFSPRESVEVGAEAVIDAVVSGAITDAEYAFDRRPKWARELALAAAGAVAR